MPIKTPISRGRAKQAKNVAKPGMRSLSKGDKEKYLQIATATSAKRLISSYHFPPWDLKSFEVHTYF